MAPAEDASGGKAVACAAAECTATLKFTGVPGWYTLRVQYFDQRNGVSRYRLRVAGQMIDEWPADQLLPTTRARFHILHPPRDPRRRLRPGDEIRIEGRPDAGEPAALDYLEIASENQ